MWDGLSSPPLQVGSSRWIKKTTVDASNAAVVELRKTANRVADKDTNVCYVDIVFNTKSERRS